MADNTLRGTMTQRQTSSGTQESYTDKTTFNPKRRKAMLDMLASGEDPKFVKFNHVMHGYDEAEADDAINTFYRATGKPSPLGDSTQSSVDFTPAKQQELTVENDNRLTLINNAKEYKDLIDKYGFESTITNPEVAGKMSGLRSNILADIKKAETLGTLDKGLLDFADMLIGEDPTGPVAPLRNIGGAGSKVVSAKINEVIANNAQKIAANKRLLGEKPEGENKTGGDTGITEIDNQAAKWLESNPDDPRAEKIRAKLESKGFFKDGEEKTTPTGEPLVNEDGIKYQGFFNDPISTGGKIGETVGGFLGGDDIGAAIGNLVGGKLAQSGEAGKTIQDTFTKFTELKANGTIDEDQYNKLVANLEETAKSAFGYDGPSFRQIAGDVLQAGLTVGTLATGGAASFAGKVAQGAATGYGFDVASGLQNKEESLGEAFTPGIGTAVGAGLPVVGAGLKLGATAVKKISSYLSGVPEEAITQAFENPDGVKKAINTFVKDDDAKMKIVQKAKEGLAKIAENRGAAYEEALGKVQSSNTGNLSKQSIRDAIEKTLTSSDIQVSKGGLNFDQSALPKAQQSQIKEVVGRINTWKDSTPVGLNKLRKVVDSYYKGSAESKSFDRIVLSLKDAVQTTAETAHPAIGEMNKAYSADSALIKQITKELSLGKDVSPTTALNKLTSIFNRNGEFKEKLVRELGEAQGQQLLDDIVGSMFTEWFPKGLTGRIISSTGASAIGAAGVATGSTSALPALAAGAVMSSPRVVGKVATTAGKLAQKVPTETLKKMSKTALLDYIAKYQSEN